MKDHQPGYTQPIPILGAKIEQHQATPEDRMALERCKFEQKRYEYPLVLWTPQDWQQMRAMLNWIHGGQDEQA